MLEGRDTLAVMPTRAGKSAIYQLAGARLPGATLVVSPLLALQHDQLEALEEAEVGSGAAVNSARDLFGLRQATKLSRPKVMRALDRLVEAEVLRSEGERIVGCEPPGDARETSDERCALRQLPHRTPRAGGAPHGGARRR